MSNNKIKHICKHVLCNKIPNIEDTAWKCKGLYIIIEINANLIHNKVMYNKLMKKYNCHECAETAIQLSNLCGQTGPILGNYQKIYDEFENNNEDLFSELYDKALCGYNHIFIDNAYQNIYPIIWKQKIHIIDGVNTNELQQLLRNYWIPMHDILVAISCHWNMAGKCHSTRQKFRELMSMCKTIDDVKKLVLGVLNELLRKFCIPFEHTNISDRIIIIVEAIMNIYQKQIACSIFIKLSCAINEIITKKLTYKIIKKKFLTL